ncbi:hypothetical protein AB0P07_26195 [Streptomyces sp. NPDC085944]
MALFDSARSAARAALRGQKGLGIPGAAQIAHRLDDAFARLARKDATTS